jgi:hypothetical protein
MSVRKVPSNLKHLLNQKQKKKNPISTQCNFIYQILDLGAKIPQYAM